MHARTQQYSAFVYAKNLRTMITSTVGIPFQVGVTPLPSKHAAIPSWSCSMDMTYPLLYLFTPRVGLPERNVSISIDEEGILEDC